MIGGAKSKARGLARLAVLAMLLPKVPEERFDMSFWSRGKDFCGLEDEPSHTQCGTSACAAGWATTIPALKRRGLKLEPMGSTDDDNRNIGILAFRGHRGYEAAERFFSLDSGEAELLFGAYFGAKKPVTAKVKAEQICRFIAEQLAKEVK